MNLYLKEAIIKRGLKQKYIAQTMKMDPVIFSKKLIGDLSFTKSEQVQISKMLREKVKNIFPNTRGE
jgi:hypothetical protein